LIMRSKVHDFLQFVFQTYRQNVIMWDRCSTRCDSHSHTDRHHHDGAAAIKRDEHCLLAVTQNQSTSSDRAANCCDVSMSMTNQSSRVIKLHYDITRYDDSSCSRVAVIAYIPSLKKGDTAAFDHNFTKYWSINEILSPADLAVQGAA